jgi:N-acetylglutamate synthase-like GNAT family acetyltransferase
VVQIRPLVATNGEACDLVVESLPYFFGQPAGVQACAEAVRSQRGWVAEADGEIAGFVTIETRFPESVEITWLAVRADRRRGGIGRMLVEQAAHDASGRGARLLMLETVGPSEPEPSVTDGYGATREFYARLGFLPVKEVRLADWTDTAIILARVL